ncbi:conserved exported hypothetical protein [Candidatus Sulfopaludibacter sp. SbA3]|nr:conserved exported hypothetical protein [Candidatus Sulfopaludibacter sp. SbA3]
MLRNLVIALLCVAAVYATEPARQPVLVELFTSEGCSSCPPADRLLEQLDRQAIVLSEHVDYWNQLGWKDPFSSHAFTQRQEDYGRQLKTQGPYTPQMVVDGATEFLGSDSSRALQELSKAGQRPKAAVHISRTPAGLQVEVADAPHSATVFLALADNSASSQVAAGENNGRRLHHVAVVRSIRKLGAVKKGSGFSQAVALPGPEQRAVVFVQESDQGPIDGAAVWMQ